MKKSGFLLALALLLRLTAFGQETPEPTMKTLFGGNKPGAVGGYGGLNFSYTQISNLDAFLIGGRGAVVVNHNVAFGLGGQGFFTDLVEDPYYKEEYEFAGGYGGFYIEPILGWDKPVHLSFPVLIGAGGIGYVRHWANYDEDYEEAYYEDYAEDSYAFFVFEPGVEVEFNFLKFMRMALTASYRYTSDINLEYQGNDLSFTGNVPVQKGTPIASPDLLRGFNFGLIMKFGKF